MGSMSEHDLPPGRNKKNKNLKPGPIGSDIELQNLQQDVEKLKATGKKHPPNKEGQTDTGGSVESDKRTYDEESALHTQAETAEQTIAELAQQVERFMKEPELKRWPAAVRVPDPLFRVPDIHAKGATHENRRVKAARADGYQNLPEIGP